MIEIRKEQPEDRQAVRLVNQRAFGRPEEANLVDRLRAHCPDLLSLVAVAEGRIVGHVLFSPATIEGPRGVGHGMGLEMLRAGGCPFVIVLGHPAYYPRFGFEPASRYGIESPWPGVPDDAFLVLLFSEPHESHVSGAARYRPEFDEAA